jgi:hypothetical protein
MSKTQRNFSNQKSGSSKGEKTGGSIAFDKSYGKPKKAGNKGNFKKMVLKNY